MSNPFFHVEHATKIAPNLPKIVNEMALLKVRGEFSWPDWCFLPVAGWLGAINEYNPQMPKYEQVMLANVVAPPLTWRLTQGIYEFDPIVAEELSKSEFTGDIPCQALFRLPEWCVYVLVPQITLFNRSITGMFAMFEHDMDNNRAELRLYLDDGTPDFSTIVLHLGDWSVDEAVENALKESEANLVKCVDLVKGYQPKHNIFDTLRYRDKAADAAKHLLPLLLYLCSDNPEIEDKSIPEWLPQNPKPKKVRGEFKFMPAKRAHRYIVGEHLGRELKAARQALESESKGTHTITPHIRRAHWHGYWTGPRKGKAKTEQTFSLRWLPPIMVTSRKPLETEEAEK